MINYSIEKNKKTKDNKLNDNLNNGIQQQNIQKPFLKWVEEKRKLLKK